MQTSAFHSHEDSKFEIRDSRLISNFEFRISNLLIDLLVTLAVLCGAGCAKISAPKPPEVQIPKAATDLAVGQASDFIVLTFSKPDRNTDGSEAQTLRSVDIFRLSEDAATNDTGALPEARFAQRALQIMSIPSSRFSEYLKDKTFVVPDKSFTDKSKFYSYRFRYAVLFVNNKHQSAGFSNQAFIAPVPIPPAPTGLSAEGTQNAIRLRWTAPAENMDGSKPSRIAGYNIYRSEDPQKVPLVLINRAPVTNPEFEDLNFQFGTTYHYSVSTVGSAGNPWAESLPSEELPFTPRDTFAPDPPQNFNALLQNGVAILLWEPSPSKDVAGYRIYRLEKGTTARWPVQTELIHELSFRDSPIDPEKEYEYEIRAVDTYGNESWPVKTEMEKR
jgi:hypothetical protein